MTDADSEYLAQTRHKAQVLKQVLEKEFQALKDQDLTHFDELQDQKLEILSFLASEDLLERVKIYTQDSNKKTAMANLSAWDDIMLLIADCKDMHSRNEMFISRKLETIRGALQTIQSPDPMNTVEVYDRLGKIRPNRSRQTMGDA
ncbi:flagellar protein FlgN [Porticoccaceae bacterium]|nr:flagellar protein FlgN [Porticoccaceae bacterium]MDA8885311.1 flagellar protein FlgN [Porticoccaceae bacterium]MDA8902185.1 flagellar protein FlgN [Porticoccaceae bacterium]MDA8919560.1 flagellar protein FlgN [Porticoccaceae bacterium]MDA8935885.1 flagellar protein FlgN [Porticoccaceae bacterium]